MRVVVPAYAELLSTAMRQMLDVRTTASNAVILSGVLDFLVTVEPPNFVP
jgi:hypothetical protein